MFFEQLKAIYFFCQAYVNFFFESGQNFNKAYCIQILLTTNPAGIKITENAHRQLKNNSLYTQKTITATKNGEIDQRVTYLWKKYRKIEGEKMQRSFYQWVLN